MSTDYLPSPSSFIADQVALYERTGGADGNQMGGKPVVILTSTGATSGKLRKVPLMRVEHGGAYAVIASAGGAPADPLWSHNLTAHPKEAQIQDGPEPLAMTAHLAVGAERETWWQRAVEAWPAYADYATKTDRVIPVWVLQPRPHGDMG